HARKLRDFEPEFTEFVGLAVSLGSKLGPILIQLPPELAFDDDVAPSFLARVRAEARAGFLIEPRHPSWFNKDVDALLKECGIARVAADPPRADIDVLPGGALHQIVYFRLHGAPRIYYSQYERATLEQWLERVQLFAP